MKIFNSLIITLVCLSSASAVAKCVTLKDQKENVVLTWTAFKTAAKAGVSGTFDKIDLKTPKNANSMGAFVAQTQFSIDAQSVNTKKKDRDLKLAKHFFTFSGKNMISGKFLSMKNKVLEVELTINGATKKVPMSFIENKEKMTFVANGHIDVFDFTLNEQLSAINKACYALHKGKTWNDVALKLEVQLSACKK